jgi:hypothetical protein
MIVQATKCFPTTSLTSVNGQAIDSFHLTLFYILYWRQEPES